MIRAKADIQSSAAIASTPFPPCYTSRMLRLALLLTLLPTLALADVTGPARVIDGDTIEVAGERLAAPLPRSPVISLS